MSAQGRPTLTALRSIQHLPARYLPLLGMLVGGIGACVYWLAAQLWPASIAVVLCLFATALIGAAASEDPATALPPPWLAVFVLLIRYNALMALTAANLPFAVPPNVALGLIMVCGQAASYGLAVSMPAKTTEPAPRLSSGDSTVALLLGLAPAAILGIPGLAGLVVAIMVRLGLTGYTSRTPEGPASTAVSCAQQLTEACFYLGALATWKYV